MKEFWSGNLFLILLLRAQQNELNQTVFCIRTGGVYNVPPVTSNNFVLLSAISLVFSVFALPKYCFQRNFGIALYNRSLHSISW